MNCKIPDQLTGGMDIQTNSCATAKSQIVKVSGRTGFFY